MNTRIISTRLKAELVPRDPTTIGSYTLIIARALEEVGISSSEVFARAGVDPSRWHDPLQRIRAVTVRRIYEVAFEFTRDPCFGLEVSRHFRLTMLHALGHSLLASTTLRDFCTRLSRCFRFVAQGFTLTMVESGDEARLICSDFAAAVPEESEDVICGLVVRSMAELSDGLFRPQRVELRRIAPAGAENRYEAFYGCPIVFEARDMAIVFARGLLDVPLATGSEELAQHNDRVVSAYLEKLDRADFENRVRLLVIEALPSGRVTKAAIAGRLGMSARTLQTRLAERESTFEALINDTRRRLAYAYLEDPALSISEIAYLVGFAEISNFSRAFQRWTGMSPTQHRATRAGAAG